MLKLSIGGEEFYNEATNEFTTIDSREVLFEHSLVSLSKWESKHQIPFLSDNDKTDDQLKDYIRFMILSPDVSSSIVDDMSPSEMRQLQDYISSGQSATTFGTVPERPGRKEVITSELIYYWMVAFRIPWNCETWHLNRLLTLIRICGIKNQDPKKNRMSRHELAQRNRALNEQRRAKLGTKG